MKNYFKNLIGVSVLILVIYHCVKDNNSSKEIHYVPEVQPTKGITVLIDEPLVHMSGDPIEVTPVPTPYVPTPVPIPTAAPTPIPTQTPAPTPTPYVPTEEERQAEEKHKEQLWIYANEDLYKTFVKARDNFSNFYANGEASSQMKNLDIQMSQYDADYVDKNLHIIYDLLNRYTAAYEAGKFNDCITIGSQLYDMGYNYLDKNTLYQILVSNQLPSEYQGTIDFKTRGNSIYDMYGNIVLDNGQSVNIIGGTDDLVSALEMPNDDYNRMQTIAKWIRKLPNIVLNKYTQVRDLFADLDVCYFWSQTKVEKLARKEWKVIKQNGQDMYGFDLDSTSLRYSDEEGSYVYVNPDGYVYGPVQYDDNARIDYLYSFQDAMVSGEGDVYFLDNAIHNMVSDQQNRAYSK